MSYPTMKLVKALVVTGAVLAVSACNATNQQIGTVSGAAIGGIVGNQFGKGSGRIAATALGALAGGIIGSGIGRNLDANSRQHALQAEYNALEYGRPGAPTTWQGTNGTYGEVVPQQTYQVGSSNCRRYTHTIHVDGRPQTASGTACRNADGTWSPLT